MNEESLCLRATALFLREGSIRGRSDICVYEGWYRVFLFGHETGWLWKLSRRRILSPAVAAFQSRVTKGEYCSSPDV